MYAPTDAYQVVVKCIFGYLNGTHSYGLYITHSSSLSLNGFIDADSVNDHKLTSAYLVYFNITHISQKSGKQQIVARSSTEAKYKTLAYGTANVLWLCYLLSDLQITPTSMSIIWRDNLGIIYLYENPIFYARTKYVDVDYHFVCDKITNKKNQIHFILSIDQLVDVLTKSLLNASFTHFRLKVRVKSQLLA